MSLRSLFLFSLVASLSFSAFSEHKRHPGHERSSENETIPDREIVYRQEKKEEPYHGPLWVAGKGGILGYAGKSAGGVLGAYVPADHFGIALGLGLDRSITPTGPVWNTKIIAAVTCMVYDIYPFATGPEFIFTGVATPGPFFNTMYLQPGWSFWYAPFHAPIGVGSVIQGTITISSGKDLTFDSDVPTLRLFYIFN